MNPRGHLSDENALTCPEGETIKCFIYASYGNVAGSCTECVESQSCGTCQDCTAKDRCGYASNIGCAAYFPEKLGAACVGQNSCNINLEGSGQSASWVADD